MTYLSSYSPRPLNFLVGRSIATPYVPATPVLGSPSGTSSSNLEKGNQGDFVSENRVKASSKHGEVIEKCLTFPVSLGRV